MFITMTKGHIQDVYHMIKFMNTTLTMLLLVITKLEQYSI